MQTLCLAVNNFCCLSCRIRSYSDSIVDLNLISVPQGLPQNSKKKEFSE